MTKITDKLGTAHINPYRYRNYRYDRETVQSKYYNPEWGRFINADAMISTGQGLLSHNMYAYCENISSITILKFDICAIEGGGYI